MFVNNVFWGVSTFLGGYQQFLKRNQRKFEFTNKKQPLTDNSTYIDKPQKHPTITHTHRRPPHPNPDNKKNTPASHPGVLSLLFSSPILLPDFVFDCFRLKLFLL
jgi:hypothetical protein